MPLISRRTIEAVQDLPIADVVSRYNIELRRVGGNLTGCCPFHNERTPSFSVNVRGNFYKCFGCGKGGGPVNFVMEHEGLEFREAVERLANDHNIVIEYEKDERTDADIARERKREALKLLLAAAQEFFTQQLAADSPEAAKARETAHRRWGKDACEAIGIGYAPRDSRLFLDFVRRKGLSLDLCIEAGLAGRNEDNGSTYSMLRQRLTLPVRNRARAIISYSARYIGDNPDIMARSKYMNLRDSPIFKKDETLFGIDAAGKEARVCGRFVIVEGGPDVIALQNIGVMQAVATMGTALTAKHLEQMKRICSSLCFIPDSDPPKGKLHGAGELAVMRNGRLAMEHGFDVTVKEIPRSAQDDENGVKHDADSFIKSREVYQQLECVPFVVWYTGKRLKGAATSELRNEVMNEVAALMLNITDENLREMYIEKLSRLVGKMKMWRDAIKRAGRKVKEEENSKADVDGIPSNIVASLRRCGIIPRNGCYFATDDDGNLVRCSNFMFDPVLHIKNNKRSSRIFRLLNSHGEEDVVEFASSDLVTLRDFNKKLFDRGNYVWRGDAKAFVAIQEHLLEVTPSASLIEILGWNHKDEFFAFSNGVYADGKFYATDKLGVVALGSKHYFLPAFSKIHSDNELGYSFERWFNCNPQGAATLRDFVGQVVKVYGTGGMVGFAWTLASIFRDIIFERFKFFPVLNLFGRKGSGKTELARALSSLFYTLPSTPCSCANTSIPVIGYDLSHARNTVFILDEYTNDLRPERIDILKGLWGGTARSKMEDKVPVTIPVLSGVILAGQYKPEDEAIFSRCIHLMYSQTSFNSDEKRNFQELSRMVLHGNTHLLLPLLRLRDIFEKGFFQSFDLSLADVLDRLGDDKVEDRILNNWVVALAAFRVLEPHISVPFSYNELFEVVVNGIRYQNDQIRKSSDTANFWLYLDSMHTQGKVKEKCHFVIKLLSSFSAVKKDKVSFVEPKRVIFLNFKAVRGLLEQRIARQKTGSTLDAATLESYLKSLPQFLGIKQQRFQILRGNGELDEEFRNDGGFSQKYVYGNPSNALCFDYDSLKSMLDLNLETFRMREDELDDDSDDVAPQTQAPDPESKNDPFDTDNPRQQALPF